MAKLAARTCSCIITRSNRTGHFQDVTSILAGIGCLSLLLNHQLPQSSAEMRICKIWWLRKLWSTVLSSTSRRSAGLKNHTMDCMIASDISDFSTAKNMQGMRGLDTADGKVHATGQCFRQVCFLFRELSQPLWEVVGNHRAFWWDMFVLLALWSVFNFIRFL